MYSCITGWVGMFLEIPDRHSVLECHVYFSILVSFYTGAILLCTTNVSELGMWWESDNPVYGRTNNPYDTRRTPGGSSGGEVSRAWQGREADMWAILMRTPGAVTIA